MKKSALLIIDVQKDFMLPSGRLPVDMNQAEEMLANINRLVDARETSGLLPVYIANEFSRFDPLNLFRNFCSLRGSEGSQLDSRLKITSQHHFAKKTGNSFSNAALASFLRAEGIDRVYLTGLQAEACVYATLLGARKLGFGITVVADAIASLKAVHRQKMIEKFLKLGAEIVSTSQILERP